MAVSLLAPFVVSQQTSTVSGPNAETRPLRVVTVEPLNATTSYNFPASASVDILNITGAGNLDRIVLSIIGSTNAGAAASTRVAYESAIQIYVDGVKELDADIGTFTLTYGYATPSGSSKTFATDRIGVTFGQNYNNQGAIGTFRKLNIPYTGSLRIALVNAATNASGQIFSQVEYYSGAAPSGRYPAYQKRFHSRFQTFTGVAQYSSIDLLPMVTGSGCLESIIQVTYGTNIVPTFLEGNPTVLVDNYAYTYGGTEDFFGGNYYWSHTPSRRNEMGVAYYGQTADVFLYGTWRFFNESPMVFNTGIKYTWVNGQINQGIAPGTATVSSVVTYYTAT